MIQKFLLVTFYFLLFLLPLQLGKHFWPDYTRVAGFRIDYLSPTLYLTDLIIFLLFLLWLLSLITKEKQPCRWFNAPSLNHLLRNFLQPLSKNRGSSRINVSDLIRKCTFLLLMGLLATSFLISIFHFPFSIFNSLFSTLTFFKLIFLAYLTSQLKIKPVIAQLSLLGSLIYTLLIALFQFINQSSLNNLFYWLGERTFTIQTPGIAKTSLCEAVPFIWKLEIGNCNLFLRSYATFPHPNALAGYAILTMLIVYFLHKCCHPGSMNEDLPRKSSDSYPGSGVLTPFAHSILNIPFLTFLISSCIIFLTFSRTAILAWLLISSLIIVQNVAPLKSLILNLKSLTIILSSLFIILLAFPFLILTQITPSISPYDNLSLTLRSQNYISALELIKTYPFFGVGPGNTILALASLPDYPSSPRTLQPIHNFLWHLTTQIGVVGLLISGMFVYKFIKIYSIKLLANSYLLIAAVLVTATTDHYWYTLHQNQLLLVITIGLIINGTRHEFQSPSIPRS